MLTRQVIITELQSTLQPLDYVFAMWEGGAAAFDRVDEWSDIDVQFAVADERVEDTWTQIDQALQSLSPFAIRHRVPEPAWHGHSQIFYRLELASPFLMVDVVVIKESNPKKFLEVEIHGQQRVYFDKAKVVQAAPLDAAAVIAGHRRAVVESCTLFELFQPLTLKEINRQNWIEAFAFYQSWTLRPLLRALHALHAPFHTDFHTRYVYYDFPPEVVQRLEPLFFVRDGEDLRRKHAETKQWFLDTVKALEALKT
jgi:hypothetical protein